MIVAPKRPLLIAGQEPGYLNLEEVPLYLELRIGIAPKEITSTY